MVLASWLFQIDFAYLWLTPNQWGRYYYERQQFAEAAKHFVDPQWRAIAAYRSGDFEKSASIWSTLSGAEAAFNLGNSLTMSGKYQKAIKAYERALIYKPRWKVAIKNKAIAKARLERLGRPEDAGGVSKVGADEIVVTEGAKGKGDKIEDSGQSSTPEAIRSMWLRRVQTKPRDFLRIKFAQQLANRKGASQ